MSPIRAVRRLVRCPADRNYNRPVQPSLSGQRRAPVARRTGSTMSSWCWATTTARASPGAAAPCSCTSPAPASQPTEGCIALARPHLLRLLQAVSPQHRRRSQRLTCTATPKKRPEMPKHRAEFRARLGEGARSGDVREAADRITGPRPAVVTTGRTRRAARRRGLRPRPTSLTRMPIVKLAGPSG